MRDLIWDPDEQPEPGPTPAAGYTMDAIAKLRRAQWVTAAVPIRDYTPGGQAGGGGAGGQGGSWTITVGQGAGGGASGSASGGGSYGYTEGFPGGGAITGPRALPGELFVGMADPIRRVGEQMRAMTEAVKVMLDAPGWRTLADTRPEPPKPSTTPPFWARSVNDR